MKNYLEFNFSKLSEEEISFLIASLTAIGFEGFEERRNTLIACIPEDLFQEEAFSVAARNFTYSRKLIAPKNWNAEWENSFQPVKIGDFCAVRASFHPENKGVKFDIIITPRMSFGTGHHATTSLMISAMKGHDFLKKNVLDFGTGTGILAILAEKLGGETILAIDNDEWSIANAGENIAENGAKKIALVAADHIPGQFRYDLILANINKVVLLSQMSSIANHLNIDGILLMSGLLKGDLPEIRIAMEKAGIKFLSSEEKEGWVMIFGVLKQAS